MNDSVIGRMAALSLRVWIGFMCRWESEGLGVGLGATLIFDCSLGL